MVFMESTESITRLLFPISIFAVWFIQEVDLFKRVVYIAKFKADFKIFTTF